MVNSKVKFILASASPRRRELISHLQIPFEVIASTVEEESLQTDPVKFSREIASLKGEDVVSRLKSENKKSFLVVSADTIVCLGPKIYGKPKNSDEARIFLAELSNKTHSVFTAVALFFCHEGQEKCHSFVEESRVTFNEISPTIMDRYLLTKDSLDKAGAYGIQGPSLTFISRVEGDYANVVGFPLSRFVSECDNFFKPYVGENSVWQNLF